MKRYWKGGKNKNILKGKEGWKYIGREGRVEWYCKGWKDEMIWEGREGWKYIKGREGWNDIGREGRMKRYCKVGKDGKMLEGKEGWKDARKIVIGKIQSKRVITLFMDQPIDKSR